MKFKTILVLDIVRTKQFPNHYVYRQRDKEPDFCFKDIKILKDYFVDAPKELILEVKEISNG